MTTEVNCGQVRGPVQLAFSRSIEPIVPQEISITRMAVTNEKDEEKERTMGRKYIVPYGLYRMHGYVSAPYAARTGFSEDDLELFWSALEGMMDHDRSAARGEMAVRKLVVFKHQSSLGNARASDLFDTITVSRKNGDAAPARKYDDYTVTIDRAGVPENVEVIERV
jgi:CRISPR-associated protein Csd2